MKITWFGTASIALTSNEGRLLVDPFVPLPGACFQLPVQRYDCFDNILVTHGHFDHIMNIPQIIARNPKTTVWATQIPCSTLRRRGVSESNLHRILYGDQLSINGFSVKVYHGRHAVLPKVTPALILHYLASPHRRNLPHILWEHAHCSQGDESLFYQIKEEGKSIGLMGSLNLREDVDYPVELDLLILPYNGWRDNLSPARQVIERLQPKHILLDHWDVTFPPLTEPIDLQPIMSLYGDRITLLQQTETMEI